MLTVAASRLRPFAATRFSANRLLGHLASPNPRPSTFVMSSDDAASGKAAATAAASQRRLASIGRHVQPSQPLTTSTASSSPAGPSEALGTLRLGPNVSIPVFSPQTPSRLPSERLLLNLDDPLVLEHLEFLGKKWQLRQDVFLLAPPGPYARRLSLTFAALLQLPYEYISFHRDIGEAEMLQARSLTSDGSLEFIDGPVVRAMKNGHLLILEGVEKAERGVTPIINNILENREQNLADGRHLIPADKLQAARKEEAKKQAGTASNGGDAATASSSSPTDASESRFIPVHPNFRVIAIGVPIPPYKGHPLDPPFRSRFQARWVEGSVDQTLPLDPTPLAQDLCQRWSSLAALLRYHTTLAEGSEVVPPTSRLPNLPTTATPLLLDLTLAFPPTQKLPPILDPEADEERTPGDIAIFAPQPRDTSAAEDSAKEKIDPSIVSALSAAYPQIYSLDKDKQQTLRDLLAQLRLDGGLGVPDSQNDGAGYMGYSVLSIERLGPHRAKVSFTNDKGASTVSLDVPCGPLPFGPTPQLGATLGKDTVITPRVMSTFSRLIQLHAIGRDICLVPGSFDEASAVAASANAALAHKPSSSTTTCISLMASALGYAYESVWLWKDLGGGELLMRRSTAPDGSTGWEPAPLVRGAMQGKLIHLAGVDVLGPTLGSLSRLLQDRESELWNGGRLSLGAEASQAAATSTAESDAPLIPDTFRVVATATKATGWLNEEATTLFATCITTPMDGAEEREIVLRRTGLAPDSSSLKRLFTFVQRYRELSSDPTLGLAKSRRLGTRQVIRMASRLALEREDNGDDGDCDLHGLIWRSLLVDFLPSTVREVIASLLQECNIQRPGSEGAFRFVPKVWLDDPEVKSSTLEFSVSDGTDHEYRRRVIPRFDAARNDPDGGTTLIPDLGGSFYNNSQQSALLCSFAEDLELLGEHLLLMGSQGTGKNKLIDRTLELLNRPREYIQMNRDSTVGGILQQIALENGQIRYYDSPLVRAVKLGRILIVDEADKCSTAVSAVFKSLAERGELSLPDGRRIRPADSKGDESDVIVHPSFRLVLLSNRPGWPFFGNNFIEVIGEGFSCYAVSNPDIESEVRLLHAAAPAVPMDLLRKLDLAFHDLRNGFEAGLINHPYSLRELLHLVAHMQKFPDESLSSVLLNTLTFDLHRPEAIRWVVETLRKRGLPIEDLDIAALRNKVNPAKPLKITFEGQTPYDPKKAGRSTDLDKPKAGKEDPENNPHVGGNTWRGGVGGRDTAGLGGRGGYERLYKGHKIHQVSQKLKDDVPEHIKKQARAMAREALEKQLRENGLAPHEAVNMHELTQKVAPFVQHLSNVLNDLKANEEERAWVSRQQDGELDERRLSEGLMGERTIFKRRSERPPEIGAPMLKPKRIRLVLDASASMYHMQFDGRLQRELEVCLMFMQAFARTDPSRFALDIVAHSGDTPVIPLVPLGKLPRTEGDQYRTLRAIVSHTQYCDSGDYTLKCIEQSIRDVKRRLPPSWLDGLGASPTDPDETTGLHAEGVGDEGTADDYFVIALSDANLARYGINPQTLSRTLKTDEKVKTSVIFIDKGNEAVYTAKALPGKAYMAREISDVPRILSNILTAGLTGS